MNGIRRGRPASRRRVKVAPVASAIRRALAASAAAFALAGSGAAFAGDCTPPDANGTVVCTGVFTDTVAVSEPVDDLTVVVGSDGATTIDSPNEGIEAFSGGHLEVLNSAVITSVLEGIHAEGADSTLVSNSADITAREMAIHAVGGAEGGATVNNSGKLDVSGYGALGIEIDSAGDATVDNLGDVDATGNAFAAGINVESSGDATTIGNQATLDVSAYYEATGIRVRSDSSVVATENTGDIRVDAGDAAFGVNLDAGPAASVDNSGSIDVYADLARGITADAYDITVVNDGTIYVEGYDAIGIDAEGYSATVTVDGSIDVIGSGYGTGIEARADTVRVTTSSGASIYAFGQDATGIEVGGDDVMVSNAGDVEVDGLESIGIEVGVGDDSGTITNSGVVSVAGHNFGAGLVAGTSDAALYVTNSADGEVNVYSTYGSATGIGIDTYSGPGTARNEGLVDVAAGGSARGVSIYAGDDATASNDGTIHAYSQAGYGYAVGMAARSYGGDSSVDNGAGGSIVAEGVMAIGLAGASFDGDVVVANSGSLDAIGDAGGAGVRAMSFGDGSVTVSNDGTISGSGLGYGAYGIYVSGDGDNVVTNSGDIVATSGDAGSPGSKALGISSFGESVAITNEGRIEASSTGTDIGMAPPFAPHPSSVATGIYAAAGILSVTTGAGSAIHAYGLVADATGIELQAEHEATVNNAGAIHAGGFTDATGVLVEVLDGPASVHNAEGGGIFADSGDDAATGIVALSSYGDVLATNDGSIDVAGAAAFGYAGTFAGAIGIRAEGDGAVTAGGNGSIRAVNSEGMAAGIVAVSRLGDVSGYVGAGGSIHAEGNFAAGFYASALYGDAIIENAGGITAIGSAVAGGIGARSGAAGNASVVNLAAGDIHVDAGSDDALGIHAYAYEGEAYAGNAGTIVVAGDGDESRGIYASGYASATAVNDGRVSVMVSDKYGVGMEAESAYGDVVASNGESGIIELEGGLGIAASTVGIVGSAYTGSVTVENAGLVSVVGMSATGLRATTEGNVMVSHTGSIELEGLGDESLYGSLRGISAQSFGGPVDIASSGSIVGSAIGNITGIEARGTSVAIDATGTGAGATANQIHLASSQSTAVGIDAHAGYGDVDIASDADISVESHGVGVYGYGAIPASAVGIRGYGESVAVATGEGSSIAAVAHADNAVGIDAWAFDAIEIDNGGDIDADSAGSMSLGILARASGLATLRNTGAVRATITESGAGGSATGIGIMGGDSVAVVNDGLVAASTEYGQAIGVLMQSTGGGVGFAGDGEVDASGLAAIGVVAAAMGSESITIDSGNDIRVAASEDYAAGILAQTSGDVDIAHHGDLEVTGGVAAAGGSSPQAVGIFGAGQSFRLAHDGSIRVSSTSDDAQGVMVHAGDIDISGDGGIEVSAAGEALGIGAYGTAGVSVAAAGAVSAASSGDRAAAIYASSYSGDVAVSSLGGIDVDGELLAAGIVAVAEYGDIDIEVAGDVLVASAVSATGIDADAAGDISIANSGTILVAGEDEASGMSLDAAGTVSLANSGRIAVESGEGFAVRSRSGTLQLTNTGTISGAVVADAGDDRFENGSGGLWTVAGVATDFGAGDDAIVNSAGAAIELANGSIALGAGDDAIVNSAGAVIELANGSIDLGAGANTFVNAGLLLASGETWIGSDTDLVVTGWQGMPMSVGIAPLADPPSLLFTNDGVIDLADGWVGDVLGIAGDFDGEGEIRVDLDIAAGTSDIVEIGGNVLAGTQQTVHLQIDGAASAAGGGATATFVSVAGDVPDGAFTAGEVSGFDASDFLDFSLSVDSAEVGGVTLVYATATADGLNDNGVLAATLAPAARSLINSSIGTLRQRIGGGAWHGDADAGLGAWARIFNEEGDIAPGHEESLATSRDFGFEQSNHGVEFGIGANFDGPLAFGLLFGEADGKQRMRGFAASDHIELSTVGLYATWATPRFYVDLSRRWMDFDATLMTPVGERRTSGGATATNLEAGFTGWSVAGINVVPQVQYTRASIDDIQAIEGSTLAFEHGSSVSERSRIGVAVDRSFQAGEVTWTPFAALSSVREMDGDSGYRIAGLVEGSTTTGGSSTLLEAGIGARWKGLSASLGANWSDGGAIDGFAGGHLVLRYSW